MKNKKQGRSRLFAAVVVVFAVALSLFVGKVDARAAETYRQTRVPTKQNPVKTIVYTNRGDDTYTLNIEVDFTVYSRSEIKGINDAELAVYTEDGNTVTFEAASVQPETGQANEWFNVTSTKTRYIKAGEKFTVICELYKMVEEGIYGEFKDFQKVTFTAPIPEKPENVFSKVTRYLLEEKYSGDEKYKVISVDMLATKTPAKGEYLWAYDKDTGLIYGKSTTNKVTIPVYRNLTSSELDITDKKTGMVLIIAKDQKDLKDKADQITLNVSDKLEFRSWRETIGSCMAMRYNFLMGSSRYDQIKGSVEVPDYYKRPDIIDVYNYSTSKGEGSLYKRFTFNEKDTCEGKFTINGLNPDTKKNFTVHLTVVVNDGCKYEYVDGSYWRLKSAGFKTPSIKAVKFETNKVKIRIKVPSTQAAKGLSTMYVYQGKKRVKTIKSNGKTDITYMYKGKKASAFSYKIKAVCAKNKKITKTSKAKKAVANKYRRPGYINSNLSAITPYATATFVPWQMSYYNGKVTVTGYIANNRIFKLKTFKVKVGVGNNNKIYASTTKTYKNIKDSTIKKVTFSFKTKKAPDFVNSDPTYSVRILKTDWGF